MAKTNNLFVISLDFGYVLHYFNAKNTLYIHMSTIVYVYQKYIHTVV